MQDTRRTQMVISEFQASLRRLVEDSPDRRWVLEAIAVADHPRERPGQVARKRSLPSSRRSSVSN